MGRPIHKKYFGNRNIGTTGTSDNGIGGEGLATISVATAGSFVVSDTYKEFPLLNIGAPTLPGGVQAEAAVVFEIATVTFASGGQTDGDYVAGLSTAITGLGGGAVVNIVEVANKVTAVNLTGGNRGEFTRDSAFDGTGITTFQVLQAPNAGTDLQINITFRVKSITVTEKGSGYSALPQLSWSDHDFTGQTTPSGNTPALTTDSGFIGSATNQENAIVAYAWVDGGREVVDIVKQTAARRYTVKGADGLVKRAKLVAATSSADGQVDITATDANGNTYFVTKLTQHRALLTQRTQNGASAWLYETGQQAPWSFAAPATTYVQIENA